MRTRIALCVVWLGISLPAVAFAERGILLLADNGRPEWNSEVSQLAAAVDKQKPTEVAFCSPTSLNAQPAIDRLVQRDVSEIAVVPLFVGALPPDFRSSLKSPVPLRMSGALNEDPLLGSILSGPAQAISTNPAAESLVLISYGSFADGDRRWIPDLAIAAQQLNRTRAFATIVTMIVPPSGATARDGAALRGMIERQAATGRRILVVPVLTPYGGVETAISELLQDVPFETARTRLMSDERLIAWIVSRAEAS